MAIQFQIRRGTTAQNDAFIGAVGEMTLDTTKNEIRVHDGVTAGGHKMPVLVDVQYPTEENGYTWYRKYNDGWVEQGGRTATNIGSATIVLPIEMADNKYSVICACAATNDSGSGGFPETPGANNITATGFEIDMRNADYRFSVWEVRGIAA